MGTLSDNMLNQLERLNQVPSNDDKRWCFWVQNNQFVRCYTGHPVPHPTGMVGDDEQLMQVIARDMNERMGIPRELERQIVASTMFYTSEATRRCVDMSEQVKQRVDQAPMKALLSHITVAATILGACAIAILIGASAGYFLNM